ncbi:MAG: glycosyltransferase family protein [Rhodospirillaceae bacterium]
MSKGRGYRIGFRLSYTGSFDVDKPVNVMGDELVAVMLGRALKACDEVDTVLLVSGKVPPPGVDVDIMIHFNAFLQISPEVPNLFYLQNVFPPNLFPGGTPQVFKDHRELFDGFLFTSEPLRKAMDAEGLVLPFATEPSFFQPPGPEGPDPELAHPVSFCGNNIRGWEVNRRFLAPAMRHGLVIYGGMWERRPYDRHARGKLPMDRLPALYAASGINLNLHLDEHVQYETLNLRVYDCLACGGFMLSDPHPEIEAEFSEAVAVTQGDQAMGDDIQRYLKDADLRQRMAAVGRRIVLEKHTYRQRADLLLRHLKEIL